VYYCLMLSRSMASLSFAVLLAACGASMGSSGRSKTQCPDSQSSCLTAPSCAWDEGRACEMCHCSPPEAPPDYTPQGPPRME
jgi:hypothetical protein